MRLWFGVPILLAAGLPFGAQAQSFDCAKAHTPSERAICAQPSLGALDRAVADAYAAALARPGADAAALRASEQAWLRSRDAGCSPPARRHASLAGCLSAALTARLTALTPAAMPAEARLARTAPADPADPILHATLDVRLQTGVTRQVRTHLILWHAAGAQQAAVMVVRRGTGEVLADAASAGWATRPGG